MSRCPVCEFYVPDGPGSAWREVAHMQVEHPEVVRARLREAGLDADAGFGGKRGVLSLEEAGIRVEARVAQTVPGSGFEGMRVMFDDTTIDRDEAFAAVSGLSGGVPSPLTEEQHHAVLTALVLAMLAGYEVGCSVVKP